ncbi:hypothetical protein BZA70DRAFT_274133 [Myxozyma melibiosi]|uniref:SMP-30/Gluconolactonase/LRE-like region domain-containing protein n=1 Tax=Myxozyma melibiosi TaxID=54550 RepID=A0ABR1FFX4_9ASCO
MDLIQRISPALLSVLPTTPRRSAEPPAFSPSATIASTSSPLDLRTSPHNLCLRPFAVFDDDFLALLGPSPSLRVVAQDSSFRFAHEAGIWIPSSRECFFTSNQFYPDPSANPTHKSIQISKIKAPDTPGGTYSWEKISPSPDIPTANGGINYNDGALFCSQGYGDALSGALVYMDVHPPYASQVLLNHFHGRPLNCPNDVVVLPLDGTIWFTDPDYAIIQNLRTVQNLPTQVYCFNPATGNLRVVADGFKRPNGISFAPDFKTCYISDTNASNGLGGKISDVPGTIYAFDVVLSPASTKPNRPYILLNKRVFAFADSAAPDGIKTDTEGNVYSGCSDGIQVWNSDGILIGKILIPGGIANFCFTDPGVILAFNENRIVEVRLNATGSIVKY